jgi:hypothetical protein
MTDARLALRATAALAVGAFVLHQLRYVLGYGESAMQALAAHGHDYLAALAPVVALLVAVSAGQFLAQLARAKRNGEAGRGAGRFGRVWAAAAAVLFSTYAGQELLEGAVSAAHPGGVAAVLGEGGWWALPLALAIGLVVALLMRGADACLALAARRSRTRTRRPIASRRRPASVDLPARRGLAEHMAGRAPPLASA